MSSILVTFEPNALASSDLMTLYKFIIVYLGIAVDSNLSYKQQHSIGNKVRSCNDLLMKLANFSRTADANTL